MVGFEGFKHYEEVSRFFGPKLMEVFEAGFDEDEMSFDSIAEETLKKLKDVKTLVDESDENNKLYTEPEPCETYWEMYRIGISILARLHEIEYEEWGLKNENIRDLSYYLLCFMTNWAGWNTEVDQKSALEIFPTMDFIHLIRKDQPWNK